MDERQSRVPVWAWVFLALLGLAAAFLVFSLLSGDDSGEPSASPSASQASTTPAPVPTQTNSDPSDSICGLPAGDQSIPEEAPETTWELINGIAVPVSEEFGPGIRTDTELKCFAHNPTGALFAAGRVLAMFGGSEETDDAFARDPNQVAFLVESQRQEYLDSEWNPSSKFQIKGFKLDIYDTDNVLVTLVAGAPANSGDRYADFAFKFLMKWQNGDWVLQLGSHFETPEVVDSLVVENFIPWSGVN